MSDSTRDADPIPCKASAELDASTDPARPLGITVEVPPGFDPDAIADAVRLEVTVADE